MARFASRIIDRFEVAQGTMVFAFERPGSCQFTAGQFVTVILSNPPYTDAKGNRRTFSIASPPQEASHLEIATRMTGSALKRSLAEVPLGTPVDLLGPAGPFTLHADAAVPAVFIAGGIGITPFRSMAHDAWARGLAHAITLIYSNRTPEGAAFHEEFLRLAERDPKFRYIPTMTQADASRQPWAGERRRITAEFLHEYLGDLAQPIFYLAGPPGLVAGVTKVVIAAGAEPARVRAEEFEGY